MSNVVLELASKYQTETLLDLGSGKAYLSQVVAAQAQQPDMKVLAVDSSSTNSNSATKRSQKLEVGVFSFSFHIESQGSKKSVLLWNSIGFEFLSEQQLEQDFYPLYCGVLSK